MKKLVLIWLALSIVFVVLFGVAFDFENYITTLNDKLPNWSEFFVNIKNSLNDLNTFDWGAVEVTSLETFFQAFGNFFVGVGNFFKFIFNCLVLPIRLLVFIIQTIVAIIPFGGQQQVFMEVSS